MGFRGLACIVYHYMVHATHPTFLQCRLYALYSTAYTHIYTCTHNVCTHILCTYVRTWWYTLGHPGKSHSTSLPPSPHTKQRSSSTTSSSSDRWVEGEDKGEGEDRGIRGGGEGIREVRERNGVCEEKVEIRDKEKVVRRDKKRRRVV